jgi:TonB family protein
MQRDLSKVSLANAGQKVIEPPPDLRDLPNRKLDVTTRVIEPPPSADLDKLVKRTMNAPQPSVIEPPPDANVARTTGAMNIGHLQATVAAPRIPVTEQRADITLAPSTRSGRGGASSGDTGPVAPPINPIGGGMQGAANTGQLIALNLHPAIPNGPLNVPPGRRAGEFAAEPEGTKDAPGTPDIKGGGTGVGGSGKDTAGAGKSNGSFPAGITIGSAPGAPPPNSIVVAGEPNRHAPNINDAAKQVMLAGNRPPRVGELPRRTGTIPDAPKIEETRIFGDKKIYTLALNMPNLVSSGGSWIIRFAQLDDDHVAGSVSAPIAMTKVDPAYPAELIRGHVEGTVVLYAIIRKDGTVGEVRVIRGVQGRLDESARTALARWKFRPGTKNGQAVDLEAVVQIPFKSAARLPF